MVITVPRHFVAMYDIQQGDTIEITAGENGEIILRPPLKEDGGEA